MAERVLSTTTMYPGDVVRFTDTITDPNDGSAIDPDALMVKVKDPSGNVVSYTYGVDSEIVTDGTGVYYIDITPDAERRWYVQLATTTPDDVDEYYFSVSPSEFD